ELSWLRDNAKDNPLITDHIIPRALRRLMVTGKATDRVACVTFLDSVHGSTLRLRALEGMTQALQNQQVDAPPEWKPVLEKLLADASPDVQRLARRLSVNFRDAEAVRRALGLAADGKLPVPQRLEAVRDLGVSHPPEAIPL